MPDQCTAEWMVHMFVSLCEAVGGCGGGRRSSPQRCHNAPYDDTETRAPSLLRVYVVNDCATHWSDRIVRRSSVCGVLFAMTALPPSTRSAGLTQTGNPERLADSLTALVAWLKHLCWKPISCKLGVSRLFALAGSKNKLRKREAWRTGHCDYDRSALLAVHSVGGREQLSSGVEIHDLCLTASCGHL